LLVLQDLRSFFELEGMLAAFLAMLVISFLNSLESARICFFNLLLLQCASITLFSVTFAWCCFSFGHANRSYRPIHGLFAFELLGWAEV
jgi:hypothetical protein